MSIAQRALGLSCLPLSTCKRNVKGASGAAGPAPRPALDVGSDACDIKQLFIDSLSIIGYSLFVPCVERIKEELNYLGINHDTIYGTDPKDDKLAKICEEFCEKYEKEKS